jgi:chitodextrinase
MRRYYALLVTSALVVAGSVGVVLTARTADAAISGNIALNKPTRASTSRAGHRSALAVDGKTGTRWESARSGATQWISVDLGQLYHLTQGLILWRTGCVPKSYQVQTSRDGVNWLRALTGPQDREHWDILFGFNEVDYARYVRVYGTKPCRAGAGYALVELQLRGTPAETVPPTAPTGVHVTGATPSSISLAWKPGTDNVAVKAYAIYVDGVRVFIVSRDDLATTVTGLKPDKSYRFTVVTLDSSYNPSPPSSPVTGHTRPGEPVPPTAPGNPRVTNVAPPCVTLAWDRSTDNVGVVGYSVTRDSDPPVLVTATKLTSCGLVGNKQYNFRIVARDAAGNVSPPTDISVTIPPA